MADVINDNTDWTPFSDYCIQRADRIPIDNYLAQMKEAERLVLEQILRSELELRWYDAEGLKHAELPTQWFIGCRYDSYRNAIFEPLPGGRALYQPQVRERRRKLDKPVDEVIAPVTETDKPVRHDESAKLAEAGGNDEPADQWPWRKHLALRAKRGSEPWRIQVQCEKNLEPSIQHFSVAKIRTALENAGMKDISDSSVRRAFKGPGRRG
jgi:hypothetical protein